MQNTFLYGSLKVFLKEGFLSVFFLHSTCTPLLKAEFFIEPPPDTQRIRRRGERGIGVARSSYLFLTSLSPLSPHTARLLHCLGPPYQD
jgi:hypothetical protein